MALFIFLLGLLPSLANGATVYVPTKNFAWQWGEPPGMFEDFFQGTSRIRAWLEAKSPPRLTDSTPSLRRMTKRYFDLEEPLTVRFAVMAPPRSTNGHNPYFFAWVEWVVPDPFPFDLLERRFIRKAGIAKIAIENGSERNLDIREWHYEKELRDADLGKILPWDAAVMARKMLDFHSSRKRVPPERANGPGKLAPY